jgi:deoxyadenosine/deoxycytidine kinase
MAGLQVALSGSIGVGKSGLCAPLAELLGARAELEDVDENPHFESFYADPAAWAFSSQLAFAAEATARHIRAQDGLPVVIDRTVYEGVFVFGRLLAGQGDLSIGQMRILEQCASSVSSLPRQPDLLVHLTAPVPVLLERIERRGRPAERTIDAPYLERLEAEYRPFLAGWTLSPILEVDAHARDLRSLDQVRWLAASVKARITSIDKRS